MDQKYRSFAKFGYEAQLPTQDILLFSSNEASGLKVEMPPHLPVSLHDTLPKPKRVRTWLYVRDSCLGRLYAKVRHLTT